MVDRRRRLHNRFRPFGSTTVETKLHRTSYEVLWIPRLRSIAYGMDRCKGSLFGAKNGVLEVNIILEAASVEAIDVMYRVLNWRVRRVFKF